MAGNAYWEAYGAATNAFGQDQANRTNAYALAQRRQADAADREAGNAFATGDYGGASGILARAGDLPNAQAALNFRDAQIKAQRDQQLAVAKDQADATLAGLRALRAAPADQRGALFSGSIAPVLRQRGIPQEGLDHIASIAGNDAAIEAEAAALGEAQAKWTHNVVNGSLVASNDRAPGAQEVYRGFRPPKYVNVPAGGAATLVDPGTAGGVVGPGGATDRQSAPPPSTLTGPAPPPPSAAPAAPVRPLASATDIQAIVRAPVQITSGARSPEHNAEVGGVSNSLHLTNQARDFVPQGISTAEAANRLRQAGYHAIDEGTHVHVDWGRPAGSYQVAQNGVAQGPPRVIQGPPRPAHERAPPSGYQYTQDGRRLEPIPGGPADTAPPPGSAAVGVSGPDFLSTLPAGEQTQVKALAEGRLQFPSGAALKTPYWQHILQSVGQYDPTFDQANPRSRAQTRVDFTSGKSAQNITALNTVIGHLDDLDHAISSLNNTGFPLNNTIAHGIAQATGTDARIRNFETAKTAVANELTRVFRGTGGAEADILAWQKQLDASSSPESLRSVVHAMAELINSRLEALGEQYRQGMGVSRDAIQLLTPDKARAFARMHDGIPPEQAGTVGQGFKVLRVH